MSGSMSGAAPVDADAAFEACAWLVAATANAAAETEQSLSAAALERWGLAAYLPVAMTSPTQRVRGPIIPTSPHGDVEAAARVGHWLGVTLVVRAKRREAGLVHPGADRAGGARAGRSVWHLFLRVSFALRTLFDGNGDGDGDAEQAAEQFARILAMPRRIRTPTCMSLFVTVWVSHWFPAAGSRRA